MYIYIYICRHIRDDHEQACLAQFERQFHALGPRRSARKHRRSFTYTNKEGRNDAGE